MKKVLFTESRREKSRSKASLLLESRIMAIARRYGRLSVRQMYYAFINEFEYPGTRGFYRVLCYHLTKLRRQNTRLNERFVDPTREFLTVSRPYRKVELWLEKIPLRVLLQGKAAQYRLPMQTLRGFASLSMFRKALVRAGKRGVEKILYVGDFGPSGILIDKIAQREMGIRLERVALTKEQIEKFNPPSRPVNMRDSRAQAYISRFGTRCWDVEALNPKVLLRLVDEKLRLNIPKEFLSAAKVKDEAARIARPTIAGIRRLIEGEAVKLLTAGTPKDEILVFLASKYGSSIHPIY